MTQSLVIAQMKSVTTPAPANSIWPAPKGRALHETNPRDRLGKESAKQMINKRRRLSRLSSAFGLALVASLAMGALAAGNASALKLNNTFQEAFLLNSGTVVQRTGANTTTCTSAKSSGQFFTGGASGEVKLTFEGCTLGNNNYCNSAGQAAGTVQTSTLDLKPVYTDAAHTKFGLLLSPRGTSVFAEMTCAFGLIKRTWTGSLIDQVTSPGLNVSAKQFTLAFNNVGQIDGSGTKYHLSEVVNGSAPTDLELASDQTMTFGQSMKFLP
jgi:hypothetical protein